MLFDNLYSKVLIEPARAGADRLLIVSGYATPAMSIRHLAELRSIHQNIRIQLIVGMCPLDGLSTAYHAGFTHLVEQGNFDCNYVYRGAPVHSKLFAWLKGENPFMAFAGSANYTQTAFGMATSKQREIMTTVDVQKAVEYFSAIEADTIICNHNETENLIRLYKKQAHIRIGVVDGIEQIPDEYLGLPSATLPISVHRRSGLNWGQRDGRNPNQAYLPIPIAVRRRRFFPPRTTKFTVLTDDGKILTAVVAQDGDKAIHTPLNNAELGLYFRRRLSVSDGGFVTHEHLATYGRDSVEMYKIDEETYFMDFSNSNG